MRSILAGAQLTDERLTEARERSMMSTIWIGATNDVVVSRIEFQYTCLHACATFKGIVAACHPHSFSFPSNAIIAQTSSFVLLAEHIVRLNSTDS